MCDECVTNYDVTNDYLGRIFLFEKQGFLTGIHSFKKSWKFQQ